MTKLRFWRISLATLNHFFLTKLLETKNVFVYKISKVASISHTTDDSKQCHGKHHAARWITNVLYTSTSSIGKWLEGENVLPTSLLQFWQYYVRSPRRCEYLLQQNILAPVIQVRKSTHTHIPSHLSARSKIFAFNYAAWTNSCVRHEWVTGLIKVTVVFPHNLLRHGTGTTERSKSSNFKYHCF